MDLKSEIALHNEELIRLRRDFHENPELGFEEFRTSEIIANYLEELGIEVQRNVAKTGVVGVLKGAYPGKTIALRSDMDALPIIEQTELEFSSKNTGVMHGCGHDGHMAMLLIAAKILASKKEELHGNVKFIFQPNEEDAGAYLMVEEGVLENPKVDAVLGMHLWSPLESGKIGLVTGALMASSYYFKLTVNGVGGHGGSPHKAISPILVGIDMIQGIQNMVQNEIDAMTPTIVTFGKFNAGSFPIIIPEKANIEGSLRCLHPNTEAIQERMREIVEGISKTQKVTCSLEFKCGNELVNNDEEMTKFVEEIIVENMGAENIVSSDISVMVGEDFSDFSNKVPGTFLFLGVGDEEKGTNYAHHHPKFNIDEDVLPIGVELHVRSVLEYLK
jgi:amidohydrolase